MWNRICNRWTKYWIITDPGLIENPIKVLSLLGIVETSTGRRGKSRRSMLVNTTYICWTEWYTNCLGWSALNRCQQCYHKTFSVLRCTIFRFVKVYRIIILHFFLFSKIKRAKYFNKNIILFQIIFVWKNSRVQLDYPNKICPPPTENQIQYSAPPKPKKGLPAYEWKRLNN